MRWNQTEISTLGMPWDGAAELHLFLDLDPAVAGFLFASSFGLLLADLPKVAAVASAANRLAFFPAWSRRYCHFAALLPQTDD
jgi:hypothetical protein